MPHRFNKAALAILVNDLRSANAYDEVEQLEQKMEALDNAGTTTIIYSPEDFNIISEIENSVVAFLGKPDHAGVSVQVHVAASPIKVQADKNFLQPILLSLLSYLSGNRQNGAIISLHVTKTVEKTIIEIQQQQGMPSAEKLPAGIAVYEKVLEDMGGELACTKSNTGSINYFRLKFCLA